MPSNRNRRKRRQRPPPKKAAGKTLLVSQRRVFLTLGLIIILATLAEIFFRDIDLIDRFAPNIATESMGIVLVLIVVQRYLERQERAQRLRGSIGGLRKASRALQRFNDTWAALVKGSLTRMPEPLPRQLAELIEPHYTEQLAHLDPSRLRGTPGDSEPWIRWAHRELDNAASLLNQIIIAYSGALDPAYVEAIDELVDDPFIGFLGRLIQTPPESRTWRAEMNAGRALREVHFARLAATLSLHNELARDAAAVRTRRIGPRTGVIGMELPLDFDLRVETALEKRWWTSLPGIGALRAESERHIGLTSGGATPKDPQ